MGWMKENWQRVIGIILINLLLPAYIAAAVKIMTIRYGMFDWYTAENVFDFLADFMYPYRWKNIWKRWKEHQFKKKEAEYENCYIIY